MNRRQRKQTLLELIGRKDLSLEEVFTRLAAYQAQDVINALFPALCRTEEYLRWRAVSCMGKSVARLADENLEAARVVMRRFLWSLNDESGGIGWGAPESMAESMAQHGPLAQEYAHMLISYMREDGDELYQDGNYLEHPLLQRGLLWGVARLSSCRPQILLEQNAGPDLLPYFLFDDAEIRALACIAAGNLRLDAAKEALTRLAVDDATVNLYIQDSFIATTVGELAQAALVKLGDSV
ncbi:MAG: HEAT repeat domain-containing protein [Desulfobulbaceae bacterium]|nr:HEAT repeat domain-containing protein [Desulfobulbaceae bacterium]